MGVPLFEALDAEWATLTTSKAAKRALSSWNNEVLQQFDDLSQLVRAVNGTQDGAEADRVLSALVERARRDELAARAMLQAMMPTVKSLVWRYRGRRAQEPDLVNVVVAETIDRIRNYPLERRPTRVAANIANDVRQSLWRATQRGSLEMEPTPVDELARRVPASVTSTPATSSPG